MSPYESCVLCSPMTKKIDFPSLIRGSIDILIVGESPKVSVETSMNSLSLKRLKEELKVVGINFDNCHFAELCKCEIVDRKHFGKVGRNCVSNLEKQIESLQPRLIITIGVTTLTIINEYFGSKCQIGELGILGNSAYLPLYHPSPANPYGHPKNLEILEKLDVKF